MLGIVGCSEKPEEQHVRFEVNPWTARHSEGMSSPTVLFDNESRDILGVYSDGTIQNVGTFAAGEHIHVEEKK
jgi:hypothetical protein